MTGQGGDPVTGRSGGAGAPAGLSWSWELDSDALMAALAELAPAGSAGAPAAGVAAGPRPGGGVPGAGPGGGPGAGGAADGVAARDAAGEEADAGWAAEDAWRDGALDELECGGGRRVPAGVVAGRVAERLLPGPDLAAWLASAPVAGLGDGDLAVVAGSWRRVAAWAQARELAAVAQVAARAAARDEDIGTGPDGRPVRVPGSAVAEVALELTLSSYGAAGWAHLGVELGWRLAATGAALEAGVIDLARARLIVEAAGPLSDENARKVEARVLPAAGGQTSGMLRAALRRAVIAVDPGGAEGRRKDAERRAKVVLYPDPEGTATLAALGMPAVIADGADHRAGPGKEG